MSESPKRSFLFVIFTAVLPFFLVSVTPSLILISFSLFFKGFYSIFRSIKLKDLSKLSYQISFYLFTKADLYAAGALDFFGRLVRWLYFLILE